MNLPFSLEQFLAVFTAYNTAIWPAQVVLNLLAVGAVIFSLRSGLSSKIIMALLGGFWIWTGVVYHLLFFSKVNPAATFFGAMCVLQGLMFILYGTLAPRVVFRFKATLRGYAGAALLLYGLLVYPVLGYCLGHTYPASPTFGAPCPTTIFTFGLMLWSPGRTKFYLVALPLIWSIIGFGAALSLGILEDVGLLIAGVVGTTLLLTGGSTPRKPSAA